MPCDYRISCIPDTPAYNAPKFLDLSCSWDFALSASFIYFQAKEEKLEVGAVSELSNNNPLAATTLTEIGKMSFDYKPAFRVGFEAAYCKDNWNFSVDYFRYHAKVGKASISKEGAPSSLLIANNYWGGNANTAFDAIIVF